MINFVLQLVLAHLIGDFVLQPKRWVDDKKQNKLQSVFLYYHILIHLFLLLIITQFQSKYWSGIAVIVVTHFVLDLCKIYIDSYKHSKKWFFVDQILHFFVIAIVVKQYFNYEILFSELYQTKVLLLLTTLVIITFTTAIVLKIMLEKWSFKTTDPKKDTNNAGTYIGILERLFIFVFIYINFWEGIGFLLAAKSIFRFGDLKESKDIRLTEYILVGTLLSFGIAICTSLLFNYLILKF